MIASPSSVTRRVGSVCYGGRKLLPVPVVGRVGLVAYIDRLIHNWGIVF